MSDNLDSDSPAAARSLSRDLAETYTFALLQWPALFVLLELGNAGWQLALKCSLGVWVALVALAAYGGRRPERYVFANAMLVVLAVLVVVWWSFPGNWCWFWVIIAGCLFYTAQLSLLGRQDSAEDESLQP